MAGTSPAMTDFGVCSEAGCAAAPLVVSSSPRSGGERRMPIAAARVYSDGHRLRSLWLNDPDDRPVQAHQFTWIGLVDPEPDELAVLQARFGFHPLAVEDVLCEHPIPKVSIYGDQIFVAARTA